MRRLTKEELYRFDGTPLFPERRAYTASYSLSPDEAAHYLGVTTYEREEMNRAERNDDGKRRSNVGFALQILRTGVSPRPPPRSTGSWRGDASGWRSGSARNSC